MRIFNCMQLIILLFISQSNANAKIEFRASNDSLANYWTKETLEGKISASLEFSQNFLKSYRDFINQKVAPAFLDSFTLVQGNVEIEIIFSTSGESFINLSPSDSNKLSVRIVNLPIQSLLFWGIDSLQYSKSIQSLIGPLLENYQKIPVVFALGDHTLHTYRNGRLTCDRPKFWSAEKISLGVFENMEFRFINEFNDTLGGSSIRYFGFLAIASNFTDSITRHQNLGQYIAEQNIEEIFTRSFLFDFYAFNELAPEVSEIQKKILRAKNDPDFHYPFPEQRRDILILQNKAGKLGKSKEFVDLLLNDPTLVPKAGKLLWWYYDFGEFVVQWIIINASLIILLLIILLVKILNPIFNKLSWILIISACNGWVFNKMPDYMGINYWIIPGCLFFACVLIVIYSNKLIKCSK